MHTSEKPYLVTLGTCGGPAIRLNRAAIATAVVIGSKVFLIDCGDDVATQLRRAGLVFTGDYPAWSDGSLEALFITHLHSDHISGYWNLIEYGYLHAELPQQLKVFGPGRSGLPIPAVPASRVSLPLYAPDNPTPGTKDLTEGLINAQAYNLNVRRLAEGGIDLRGMLEVRDIGLRQEGYVPEIVLEVPATSSNLAPAMDPVVIYEDESIGLRVKAILVSHFPMFPSFAFRFDSPGGSVTISGDTSPCDNLVKLAAGSDILLHEAIDMDWFERNAPAGEEGKSFLHHLETSHTTAEQAGSLAAEAGVKKLIFTHLSPGDDNVDPQRWINNAKKTFDGEIVVADDLQRFDLQV